MRLHHLSMTAFGPFAATETVDFDELSEAGLFLLTGATGAGKTSVLDAVCFALYGQVPGDRSGAKHLRSDHSPPHVAPEVVLRLSVGERQFTFTRSPSWMRPKLRGTGETKVQAHVLVEELVEGRWRVLTNRLDDAGLLVVELLGMSCNQFTQVAMLPQGRFQAFLRATSVERHGVLQQLFRTDRFERIESWLVDRRTDARRALQATSGEVLEVVNRLQEAAGTEVVPDWLDDVDQATASGVLDAWALDLRAAAAREEDASRAASEGADELLRHSADHLVDAERTADLRARASAARAEIARWEARADERTRAAEQLAAHHRAVPLTELASARGAARRAAHRAREEWAAYQVRVAPLLPTGFGPDDLAAAQRTAHEAVVLAVAFEPRAAARGTAQARLREVGQRLQLVESGIAELELALTAQPGLIADAVAAVHEARAAAGRLPLVLAQVEQVETAIGAARRAELVGLELVAAGTDVLTATAAVHTAKEHYLNLREERINAMAGELAGQLASGCSCPVCGSAEHPAPARTSAGSVGRAEEDQARKLLDDAEFDLQARQVGVATLEGELAGLDAQLDGVDRAGLAATLDAARDEVERLEPIVAALDCLVAREAECRRTAQQHDADLRAALLERADLRGQVDQHSAAVEAVDDEWAALLAAPGSRPDPDAPSSIADLVGSRRAQAELLDTAATALRAATAADHHDADLVAQLARAAQEAGFADVDTALAAILSEEAVADLQAFEVAASAAVRSASLVLEDPAVLAAQEAPDPEVDRLRDEHTAAVAAGRAAAASATAAAGRRARLDALGTNLAARVERWRPLQERYQTVADLASFVEGKSLDNSRRMRLAAYVLSERLRQVVEAANERLVGMTDQRYALEHTDDRGFGEQRGGLSLRVRDDWNGVHRDPATLSGGETFVVSLALALGLADTVAHEAGGTDIDTLFIDEGFGSLDADTLEDVMDTLDSLRDGGRVVGLVSHVPELRSRIPTQLEVAKGRAGSSVRATVSAG